MIDGIGAQEVFAYIAILAIPILFGFLVRKYQQKRTKKFQELANSLSMEFSNQGRSSTLEKISDFHVFCDDYDSHLENEIWGKWDGNDISTFEYISYSSDEDTKLEHSKQIIAIDVSGENIPSLHLRPENNVHKIGQFFGYQDIDFESSPKFSRTYLLKSDNEQKTRLLFSPKVIKHFEAQQDAVIEVKNNIFLYYKHVNMSSSLDKVLRISSSEDVNDFICEGKKIFCLLTENNTGTKQKTG